MKRYSSKSWAAAVVLAICVADCVGIYVAQVRLHRDVPISAPEAAYADATAVKDNWRESGPSPQAQRAYANTMTYTPSASAPSASNPPAPRVAPAAQRREQTAQRREQTAQRLVQAAPQRVPAAPRLAQADSRVPAYKSRTDTFLAPPKLAEMAPPERVELATEIHAAQHRAALHRASTRLASTRLASKDSVPPTSQSFAAAFGGGGSGTLALPEPSFGKQTEAGLAESARAAPITATDSLHSDPGDSATIGKSVSQSSTVSADAPDAELPALPAVVQAAALPTS